MAAGFRILGCLFLLLNGLPFLAGTQAVLPGHVIRSISPAEVDFRDLNFLAQEIGPARVVMLGEPMHEEGNVFEAKIRLLRFLQQRLGFNPAFWNTYQRPTLE